MGLRSNRRVFTDAELELAHSMRARNASWRAIARVLGCSDETIRRHIDPEFDGAARSARLLAAQHQRRRNTTQRKSDWFF